MQAAALDFGDAEQVVTKGVFAALIGVTPGRVSQMISEEKISGDAIVGEGRNARIRVETARAQLRQRTDLGQRFGNGLGTRLDGQLPPAAGASVADRAEEAPRQPSPTPPPVLDPVAERLKAIKLEQAERANRQEREQDLAGRGVYVRADHSRAAMMGVASAMLNVFEGGISDLAQALATAFELPQRDLVHVLRQEFRTLRAQAAQAARKRAQELPPLIEDDGEAEPEGEGMTHVDPPHEPGAPGD